MYPWLIINSSSWYVHYTDFSASQEPASNITVNINRHNFLFSSFYAGILKIGPFRINLTFFLTSSHYLNEYPRRRWLFAQSGPSWLALIGLSKLLVPDESLSCWVSSQGNKLLQHQCGLTGASLQVRGYWFDDHTLKTGIFRKFSSKVL